jgi:hypothetical protein
MAVPEKLTWRLYVAAVGGVTTIVTQRLLTLGWKAVTGEAPPEPGDSKASWAGALTWAVASGIGLGMSRLFARQLAEKALHHFRD